MTKIKKIPKDFIICDGMTTNVDLFTAVLHTAGIFFGMGFIWWILHKWRAIYEFFKKSNH